MLESNLKARSDRKPCNGTHTKFYVRGSKQFGTSNVKFDASKYTANLSNPYHFEKSYRQRKCPYKSRRNIKNYKTHEYQRREEERKQVTYTLKCASPYGLGLCPQPKGCKVRGTRAQNSEVNL